MIIATHQSEWIKDASSLAIKMDLYLPVQQPTGEWGCRLTIDTLEKMDKEIYGEDAFQCLKLALQLAKVFMLRSIGSGYTLVSKMEDGSIEKFDKKETEDYLNAIF
jgi:hypothetical protein